MDKQKAKRPVTSRPKVLAQPSQNPLPSHRVAIYLRVSTEDQHESGLGIAAQKTRCNAMAEVKGWPKPLAYADEGISGTKDASKRPALRKLLDEAKAGNLDAVIILSLDRLGRKTQLVLNLVEELSSYGVALISCKESLDTGTPQGQFVLTMFAALAQLERDLASQRTKDALNERGKRDGERGGRIPYGYRRLFAIGENQEKRICTGVEIDEDAAKIVRRIFTLARKGYSLREIVSQVSASGVPGPRGGLWYASTIDAILKNQQAYKGGLRSNSKIKWPVILK